MAGDWIKMRTALMTDPKVNRIARELETSQDVGRQLLLTHEGVMSSCVTRNVMRHVTVSCLLLVWGAANEHTKEGVFYNADLSDIDDIVGMPGFGAAMQHVGWLVYDPDGNTVTLENFNEYNKSGARRSAGARTNAERQADYRARKRALAMAGQGDLLSDVTRGVTGNRRVEKSREEKENKHTGKSSTVPRADDAVCVGFDSIPPKVGEETAYRARQVADRLAQDDLGVEVLEGDPRLQGLLWQGVTLDEFVSAAQTMKRNSVVAEDPFAYLSGIVRNRREQAARPIAQSTQNGEQGAGPAGPAAWQELRSVIEAHGVRLGIGLWDEAACNVGQGSHWPVYRAKVRAAFDAEVAQVEGVQ